MKQHLRFHDGETQLLKTRENTHVEFKRSFGFGSMLEYMWTMIVYANTEGVFIIFGVQNSPREVGSVNDDKFDAMILRRLLRFLTATVVPN